MKNIVLLILGLFSIINSQAQTIENKITPFLMFEGKAEEAMNFYINQFKNSEIKSITRYDENGPGKEGTIITAVFTLNGQQYMCIDSYVKHEFTFTPAISFFVKCESEEELTKLYSALSENGKVFMEIGSYGFSNKFAWVEDKYGVSWQLNLE
jgi:predicted 3-demethylubiquinone-9 3-methyltransferase (glyoxalase superfamily)